MELSGDVYKSFKAWMVLFFVFSLKCRWWFVFLSLCGCGGSYGTTRLLDSAFAFLGLQCVSLSGAVWQRPFHANANIDSMLKSAGCGVAVHTKHIPAEAP